MKIAIGFDHGGFSLKQTVIDVIEKSGHSYEDFGTFSESSCDYPDFAKAVSEAVAKGEFDRGILVCGTGIGMSIAANKIKGIRCALCHDCFSAKYTRLHNDSNILAMGERVIGKGLAAEILNIFLNTEFEGGRHAQRIAKISELEK